MTTAYMNSTTMLDRGPRRMNELPLAKDTFALPMPSHQLCVNR